MGNRTAFRLSYLAMLAQARAVWRLCLGLLQDEEILDRD